MTSRHCQSLLSPYIDGALSIQEREEVETHLSQCLACAQQLRQMERNRQLIWALPEIEVTAKMQAQLLSKVQSQHFSRFTFHTSLRRWPMLSFGTVATCAASVLFYFAMMQAPPKVSAEEVVSSMDQLIGTLDPDEGQRAITEETPDEAIPDWSDEIDRDLFENDDEQN